MSVLGVILLLIVLGFLGPWWGYSRDWGYGPVGGVGGLILLMLLILLLMGRV